MVSTLWNTTAPHLLDSRKRSKLAENGKMFHIFQKTRKTSVTVLKEIPRRPTILHEGCRSMKNCAGCRKDFGLQQDVLWNIAKFPQRILVNKAIANGFPDGYNTNRTQEMHQKCACLPCDMRMKENKIMKMISRRDFIKASAVVGAAGVLTACGGSSSSTAASSVAASSTAASSAAASRLRQHRRLHLSVCR